MTYQITATKITSAPPEEVWKLLYDASRFGSWWEGVLRTEPDAHGRLVFHRDDGEALPSILTRDRGAGQITVSCLALVVRYVWLLAPLGHGVFRLLLLRHWGTS